MTGDEILWKENYDLENIYTPIVPVKFEELLIHTNYPSDKTRFIIDGFTQGFDLGYEGPKQVKMKSANLKFQIRNKIDICGTKS